MLFLVSIIIFIFACFFGFFVFVFILFNLFLDLVCGLRLCDIQLFMYYFFVCRRPCLAYFFSNSLSALSAPPCESR